MAQATLAAMPNVLSAPRVRRQFPGLGNVIAFNTFDDDTQKSLQKVFKGMFDPYRPELHYMRGPGPKWHAKHGNTQPSAR